MVSSRFRSTLATVRCLLVLLCLQLVVRAAEIDVSARARLERWVESQHATNTLSANFVQQRQLRTIRRPMLTSGRMWWSRDDGFRWELGDPPKLVLIEDAEGQIAEIRPARNEIELRSRQQAEQEMHGLGFGFSTFFNADPSAWEGDLELLHCASVASHPEQILAEFGFREARLARAIWKMSIVADTAKGDLREFQLVFRDQSAVRLRFEPMQKNAVIDSALFEIPLQGYHVKRK